MFVDKVYKIEILSLSLCSCNDAHHDNWKVVGSWTFVKMYHYTNEDDELEKLLPHFLSLSKVLGNEVQLSHHHYHLFHVLLAPEIIKVINTRNYLSTK